MTTLPPPPPTPPRHPSRTSLSRPSIITSPRGSSPTTPTSSSSRRSSGLIHEIRPPPRRLSTHQVLLLTPFGGPVELPSTLGGHGHVGQGMNMSRSSSSMGMARAPSRMSIGSSVLGTSYEEGGGPDGKLQSPRWARRSTRGSISGNESSMTREASSMGRGGNFGLEGVSHTAPSHPTAPPSPSYASHRLRHSLATSLPHAGPSRPSPLATSHPMGTITSGSDTDRTLSNGATLSRHTDTTDESDGTHNNDKMEYLLGANGADTDLVDEAEVQLVALSLATTVPMTRFNSLPVLTIRELEAMREKDGELGIERGGDWAWVSGAPPVVVDAPRTAGPVMSTAYPWDAELRDMRTHAQGVDDEGEEEGDAWAASDGIGSWTDSVNSSSASISAGASASTSTSVRTDNDASTSSFGHSGSASASSSSSHLATYPYVYNPLNSSQTSYPALSLFQPRFTGFSDPFAPPAGHFKSPAGDGEDTSESTHPDTSSTPKQPSRAQYPGQYYDRYPIASRPAPTEVRRHTYGAYASTSSESEQGHMPTSTSESYRYSASSDARRMSVAPGPGSGTDGSGPGEMGEGSVHADGTRSLRARDQGRRPSAPVIALHARNASIGSYATVGASGSLRSDATRTRQGSGSDLSSPGAGSEQAQESPRGTTRMRMASMDRPRILRYKTSPARFTGLGLNIVVNGVGTNAAATAGATASGAGSAGGEDADALDQGLSTAERRARRHARLRARTPQDSPGTAAGPLAASTVSNDSSTGPTTAESASQEATPLSAAPPFLPAHPPIAAPHTAQARGSFRFGSWSQIGVVDRLQVDIPSGDMDDFYPFTMPASRDSGGSLSGSFSTSVRGSMAVSRGSVSRASISSISDTWTALMTASLNGDLTDPNLSSTGASPSIAPTALAVPGMLEPDAVSVSVRTPHSIVPDTSLSLRNVVLLQTTRGMSLPEVLSESRKANTDVPGPAYGGRERFNSLDSALPQVFARPRFASLADMPGFKPDRMQNKGQSGSAHLSGHQARGKGKGKSRASIFDAFSFATWDAAARFETFPRRSSAAAASTASASTPGSDVAYATGSLDRRGLSGSGTEGLEVKKEWYERRGSWAEGWTGPA